MGRFGAMTLAVVAILASGSCSRQAEMPARKPGAWELTMVSDDRPAVVIKQCIDAATDQALQSASGPLAASACSRRDVARSGDTTVIDSTCTFSGRTATSHAVVTGSFDSQYTMTITAKGEGPPPRGTMTISARWLGACPADQRPGDVIMPNGVKVNVPDMQKQPPSSLPGLPPR